MNIKQIEELIDLVAMYPSIEEIGIEKDGTRIKIRQKHHINNNKGRTQKMIMEQCELVEVKAPVLGEFYFIVLDENKKELKQGELKRILNYGNSRIEIGPGLCVFDKQVLGTIIQLNIPISVEAPCEGIIQSAFLSAEEQRQQQGIPVGYGQTLFVIKKFC